MAGAGLSRGTELDWRDLLSVAGFARDIHTHAQWMPERR
jgi:hypothetical protein